MHLILTGATGLVGTSVLDNMLAQESISRISILSRRPVKMADGHAKAKVIIHTDFNNYDQVLLEGCTGLRVGLGRVTECCQQGVSCFL